MQRVKAKVFIQDPFNSVLFTEDSVRYVDVRNIVCALITTVKISYSLKKVMLFFSLMCFNIYTNEVVTFEEAAETVEIKLQPMKHSVIGFQAEERGG